MNNKVKFLRGTATEYEASTKDNDTFYYTTDDEKLYLGDKEITGGGVTVDDTLSETSEHPVQNKVISAALNEKADQTAVDSALDLKANSADVATSLAGKSDIGHTHDDRYYTESETNNLLSNKVDVSDFNNHSNNTTVHVTETEKAVWNGKAERSDIPTTLPASGGNADTLGKFPETSFSRNRDTISDCNNATLPGTYNATPETANTPYPGYWLISVDTGSNGAWTRQTATLCNSSIPNDTHHRLCINGEWSDSWTKINDGGNADTLDNKHASDFTQNLGTLTTGSLLDYVLTLTKSGCLLVTGKVTDTPVSGVNFFVDVRRHPNGDYAITATRFNAGGVYTNRYNAGMAKWYGWANVADGGNAETANTAGTLATTASNVCLRNISAGTSDLTAGSSALATGAIYLVYE